LVPQKWQISDFTFSQFSIIKDADDESDDDALDVNDAKEAPTGAPMTKKEKMEALAKARRRSDGNESGTRRTRESSGGDEKSGYASDGADSVGSAEFQRTKEDDDFIDASGEDPEALRELYREQHFDDEEAEEDMEDDTKGGMHGARKGKRKVNWDPDAEIRRAAQKGGKDGEAPDNPIMAAVHKMKKKKKEVKKVSQLEEEAKDFVLTMLEAADDDDKAIAERRPALRKLQQLNTVLSTMAKREMARPLLDNDFLAAAGRWVRPLPNGQLGNVTVRSQLLQGISKHMSGGERGVSSADLKRSGFGKICMSLYMHKKETPEMKRFMKQLIEQWSRPIFQKSGNMKDLESAQRERSMRGSAMMYARSAQPTAQMPEGETRERGVSGLSSILAKGQATGSGSGGGARVRVPYSRGFQFTVRPEAKSSMSEEVKKAKTQATIKEKREGLNKRMVDKGKNRSKNLRSANISVEGRATK
jgi:transcription factor SPN1